MPDSLKPHWFQILFALSRGSMHGAGIMEEVLDRTGGAMKLWPATLYGSLRDLEELGWIAEVPEDPEATHEGGARRYHRLTDPGRLVLREELRRLDELLTVARRRELLGDTGAP